MRVEIHLISDVVFPKSSLPDAAFLTLDMAGVSVSFGQVAGKPCFDQAPPSSIVAVPGRHLPDGKQAIGQHCRFKKVKGVVGFGFVNRPAQQVYLVDQQMAPNLSKVDLEIDARACALWAAKWSHAAICDKNS